MQPRISPRIARTLIVQNVLALCQVVSLSTEDYTAAIDRLSEGGIAGGATYDGLILQAAIKASADQIVTLNAGHFRRIYPALADKIVTP